MAAKPVGAGGRGGGIESCPGISPYTFGLHSMSPVSWLPMQMHHSKNENFLSIFCVQNAIWKPSDQRSSDILFYDWPRLGVSKYSFNRRIDFYRKVVPQTFLTFFIVFNGLDEFGLGFRMK